MPTLFYFFEVVLLGKHPGQLILDFLQNLAVSVLSMTKIIHTERLQLTVTLGNTYYVSKTVEDRNSADNHPSRVACKDTCKAVAVDILYQLPEKQTFAMLNNGGECIFSKIVTDDTYCFVHQKVEYSCLEVTFSAGAKKCAMAEVIMYARSTGLVKAIY